ncbi:MAG: hypothetical protein Q4G43_04145 [Mobilicoccus sp.]|nr:hypothetical protein [Mobilicoccus sp.]
MPDLTSATPSLAMPSMAVPVRPSAPAKPPVIERASDSATSVADTRRVAAMRSDVEVRSMTSDGVRAALTDTRRAVRPAMESLQRLYERPATGDRERIRREEEEKLAEAATVASRVRSAAARLAAVRISLQERAQRAGDEVTTDAERLADLNRDLRSRPANDAEREGLVREQRRVVDRLTEATGATATEHADGTVDVTLDRPLVQGDRAHRLIVTPRAENTAEAGSQPADAPAGSAQPVPSNPATPSPATGRSATAPSTGTTSPAPTDVSAPAATSTTPTPVSTGPTSASPLLSTPTTPPASTPPTPDAGGSTALVRGPVEVLWSDGSPAAVGGRLGGFVAADGGTVQAAITGLDDVARAIVATTATAQTAGATRAGMPGPPLLEGDSALSLRVPSGLSGVDVAAGAPLPLVTDGPDLADPAAALAPGTAQSVEGLAGVSAPTTITAEGVPLVAPSVPTPPAALPSPDGILTRIETEAAETADGLTRRVDLLERLDHALGLASSRVGRHLSEALGAVDGVSRAPLVAALHQANAAMAFTGTAATSAVASEIAVLVGSSEPGVATATGSVGLDGEVPRGLVGLTVLSIAGESVPEAGDLLGATPEGETPPLGNLLGEQPLDGGTPDGDGAVPPAPMPVPGAAMPSPEVPDVSDAEVPAPAAAPVSGTVEGEELAEHTRVLLGETEFRSATTTVSGAVPGVDITVHGLGTTTLAVTPDPGPALTRVQGLVDAIAQAVDAVTPSPSLVTAPPDTGEPTARASALASAKDAVSSLWSSLSGGASTSAASPVAETDEVLAAVATPLVAGMGAAFVGPDGRPVIPGTHLDRGRVALDRERFAHEYVRDAVGVEAAIASVARSVAGTADAASDPRFGALAVRIQAELAPDVEYTLAQAATEQRLDARQHELERKADSLQSLLDHLHDESTWLGEQLR